MKADMPNAVCYARQMTNLILTTFDWVPEMPRGFVRDLRVRWALEEAGLPYRVESVPFRDRKPEHFVHQPFGQVPWLTDGDQSIFESGAILLHLGELSDKLMPAEPVARSDVKEWLFAALASVEAASQPWSSSCFPAIPTKHRCESFSIRFLKHG
jgi:glutathione S-transferase